MTLEEKRKIATAYFRAHLLDSYDKPSAEVVFAASLIEAIPDPELADDKKRGTAFVTGTGTNDRGPVVYVDDNGVASITFAPLGRIS